MLEIIVGLIMSMYYEWSVTVIIIEIIYYIYNNNILYQTKAVNKSQIT